MRAESVASVPFTFTTTKYQQENPEGYFKREVLNNSRLAVERTAEASHSIQDSAKQDKEYGSIQLDCREVKTGKGDIMLMGDDVRGDWEMEFFHSIACYVLTMNNCGKLWEGSNYGVDWVLPQFQEFKETSVAFRINKMFQGCVGMVDGFKK